MKKLITICCILFCGILASEEKSALEPHPLQPALNPLVLNDSKSAYSPFFYTDFGVTLFAPTPGIGWRNQSNHFGVDISLKLPLLIVPIAYKGSASLLYFPSPNPEGQFYGGIGITGMLPIFFGFFDSEKHFFAGPCLIFGKSYVNEDSKRRFWQVVVDGYPNKKKKFEKVKREIIPLVSLSYGFCF
jgi:hypothetical protein